MKRLLGASFEQWLGTISFLFIWFALVLMRLSDPFIQTDPFDVESGVGQPDMPGLSDMQKPIGFGKHFYQI